MNEINVKETKKFWDNRAKEYGKSSLETITLFSDNKHYVKYIHSCEVKYLKKIIKKKNNPKVLNLGCGVGREDFIISSFCSKIIAIDYSDNLIKIANKEKLKRNIKNIDFQVKDITKLKSFDKFDIIIITGTLIYLTDAQVRKTLKFIHDSLKTKGIVISRESSAIDRRFARVNEYDELFKCDYNAVYRSKKELLKNFKEVSLNNVYYNYLYSPFNIGLKIYTKFRYNKYFQWFIYLGFKIQRVIDRLMFNKKELFNNYVKKNYKKIQMVYLYKK
ncbi:MAG: class I SAM-dependent methyltransferase [Promethearchaeota archaeon]